MIKKPFKMMIIDDDKDMLDILSFEIDNLYPNIFEISEWTDAKEAITKVAKIEPQIILSDMNMPGSGGSDFLLKAQDLRVGARFVYITGSSKYMDFSAAFRDGANGFIQKPFTPEKLKNSIDPILQELLEWERVFSEFSKPIKKAS